MKYPFYDRVIEKVPSPSPRRAWIEIMMTIDDSLSGTVALPTEGVD